MLDSFSLSRPTILSIDPESTLTLTSSSFKTFKLESITTGVVDNITLQAEVLDSLDVTECTLRHFGLASKGNLRKLRIKDASFCELDIGPDTGILEVLPNLKELQLLGLESRAYADVMNLETIARSFPRLNHLAMILSNELMKGNMDQVLLSGRNSLLEKLVLLELDATTALNEMFSCWIEVFLEICPGLKRLVVRGNTQQAPEASGEANSHSIGGFITSFVKLVWKFSKVDIHYQEI